jgi:hypothetical protein
MASAAQTKPMLNSHYIGDEGHFHTIVLKIAVAKVRCLYITVLVIYKSGAVIV